jgi:hypothetical protein
MKKNMIFSVEKKGFTKEDPKEKISNNHHYAGLPAGYSFKNHYHGRVNTHSIGFNHEPGTL